MAEPLSATSLLAEPHHDGSELGVLERPDELGGRAVVRVRVPRAAGFDAVALRYVRDGEPGIARAELDVETRTETWWRASFPVANPSTRYRWLLSGPGSYAWLNGRGLVRHDVPDADDFVLSLDRGGPDWHLRSVVYEIFPDRFARSGVERQPPDWAIPRGWGELPTGRGPETPFEWYGGDLGGIEAHLDHVERLGANVLYLTPIFPARSTHRYDASSLDEVDPLLGGDEALASLAAAAHARGLRLIGDLTLNHVGAEHPWFRAARDDAGSDERGFFWFGADGGYESWFGVPSLPKLDHRSEELRRRLYDGDDSILRRWLRDPYALDGWRIDVANMAGRLGDVDLGAEIARRARAAVGDKLLVAEHAHDARGDLQGGGWHGTMNYPGFTRPVWTWLRGENLPDELRTSFLGLPVEVPRLEGAAVVATMRAFRAGIPWPSVLHSWALLDSHDVGRFRTVSGSRERHAVGIGLQMTTPGVPMVFAGDELGLEGAWGEDARRTLPWDDPASWDDRLLDEYRRLIALRRSSEALARGGIRYVDVSPDAIAYLRETGNERLLCVAARAAHEPIRVPLEALACSELEPLHGGDAEVADGDAVLPADGPAFHVWRLT